MTKESSSTSLSDHDFLRVGVITSPHGVHGEMRVFPTTDDPGRFSDLKMVYVDLKQGLAEFAVEGVKYVKNMVILRLSGITTRDDAERFRKKDILISRDQAVPLAENEYFIADLIGLTVMTDEGEELGKLTEVMKTGANDVYVVQGERYGEVLIPVIRDSHLHTDLEKGVITVHLLPGLTD
jgi:16S rRNA processing protein RimM